MTISLFLSIPILISLAVFFVGYLRNTRSLYLGIVGSTIIFVFSLWIGIPAVMGTASVTGNGMWYMDAFSGFMVLLIGLIQWTGMLTSFTYLHEELKEHTITETQAARYIGLLFLFIFSMLLTVVSNNLGFMWVALEATTLATTLLVAFYSRKGSIEAAWKYLMLCSTGITLGLLGLMVIYYGASENGLEGILGLQWTNLNAAAHLLPPELSRIAFALILVGFGTKVGIVPMHTWLPDAHSRAPSPISGLLSGVLLNAALFTVIRYKSIVDGSLDTSDFSNGLFLIFGALTVLVPAAFIVMQHDYKRLLAYSSIEHMGLILIAAGLGAIGAVAAVVHMAGHALVKSMLFFGAGNVLLRYKSTKFEHVAGVMKVLPITGALMLAGIFFLLAAPPSPIFLSEYLIILAAVMNAPFVAISGLISLAIIAGGFLYAFMPFFFKTPYEGYDPQKGEHWNLSHTAMLIHVGVIVLMGLALLSGFGEVLLSNIAEIIV